MAPYPSVRGDERYRYIALCSQDSEQAGVVPSVPSAPPPESSMHIHHGALASNHCPLGSRAT